MPASPAPSGNMSSYESILPALEKKLESFRRSDQERDALLQEIVRQYEQLKMAFDEKCADFDNEVQARRYWQQQFSEASRLLAMTRQQADSSPFVLALIDGDGALFTEALLRAGVDGGSDAAHKLHREIKDHMTDVYEGAAGGWSVVVHVYANLEGLSRKLASVGVIRSPQELLNFARAFSLNQPLFNLIDVGSGKERADHKIKEMLRVFISNVQCKHIIFGGCHDNGYLPNLDPYKHDPALANRISLLETTPATAGFMSLNFKTVKFPSVFRSNELPEHRPPPPSQPAAPVKKASPVQVVSSPQSATSTASNGVRTGAPAKPSSSWATVGKSSTAAKNISIAPTKPKERKVVYLNIYDQRIDEKLPKVDRVSLERFHAKIARQKMCNEYHLKGSCSQGSSCPYAHGEKLSAIDMLNLQHKARNIPCSLMGDCRDPSCFYGHNCPYDDCPRGDHCYFSLTHDMEKVPRMKMLEDGTIQILNQK